jgi:hypothetical protein
MEVTLCPEERRYFRDQLREARATALLDSEGFHPIVAALEQLGSVIYPAGNNLGGFRESLLTLARRAISSPIDTDDRGAYTPVEVLFAVVKEGRNDAVHQGAYARHLVRHCIELALQVEEGLMADSKRVADFMVRGPVCAEPWQPVALARQQMLTNSFSYLPVRINEEWKFVSDYAIASYLSESANRHRAVRVRLGSAFREGVLALEPAVSVGPEVTVQHALEVCRGRPVLVVEDDRLLGIATPFDLL